MKLIQDRSDKRYLVHSAIVVIRVLSYACILREEFKQRPGVQHSRIECVDLHAIAVNPKIHTMLRVPFCCSTQ